MTKVYTKKVKLSTTKEYSIRDLINGQAFPWMKGMAERRQYREIGKFIKLGLLGKDILPEKITGKGFGYKIKGRYVIAFIKKYGDGLSVANKK